MADEIREEEISDNNPELLEEFKELLDRSHVSEVSGIATILGSNRGGPVQILLVLESCCGTAPYELDLEMAQRLVQGLNACLECVPEAEARRAKPN